MGTVRRSTWGSTVRAWHVFWRIARSGRPSPLRHLARPVSVTEQRIPAAGVSLRIRIFEPDQHLATIVLNGGFVPESIDDPRLVNFATALAETGFLVLTPDYPAVRELEFTPATIDQIYGVLKQVRASDVWGGTRPLALIGLSYLGTLSLKAALRPDVAGPPEFLGVFGAYEDFGELMRAVFRDAYCSDGAQIPVDPYGRYLVLRSAVDDFDPPVGERERIRSLALAIGRRKSAESLEREIGELSPAGRACLNAMREFHPERFPGRWQRILGRSRDLIEALSARESASRLRSRLVILHSVYDHVLPYTGSAALHRRFPQSELILTTVFTHVNPRLSVSALWSQVRELGRLSRVFGELMALRR